MLLDESFYPTPAQSFLDSLGEMSQHSGVGASGPSAVRVAQLLRILLLEASWRKASSIPFTPEFQVVPLLVNTGRYLLCGPFLDPQAAQSARLLSPDNDYVPSKGVKAGELIKQIVALQMVKDPEIRGETVEVRGETVSVGELISLYANKLGGAHPPKTIQELRADGKVKPFLCDVLEADEPVLRDTICAVGRIVYRGLEPLSVAIHMVRMKTPRGLIREPRMGARQ